MSSKENQAKKKQRQKLQITPMFPGAPLPLNASDRKREKDKMKKEHNS
jgi:hypothetical protein